MTTIMSDLDAGLLINLGGAQIFDSSTVLPDPSNTVANSLGTAPDLQTLLDNIAQDSKGGVLLVTGVHPISGLLSVPATVVTAFLPGGRFVLNSEASVTFNGPIQAERIQIFETPTAGAVSFAPGVQDRVFPEWWGAKGDARFKQNDKWFTDTTNAKAANDDTPALKAALSAAAGRCLDVAGRHLFIEELELRDDVHVVSRNRGGFIEGLTVDGKPLAHCLFANGRHNVVFDGIYLEGLGETQPQNIEERGLFFRACSNVAVRNCEITKITVGAYFENCTHWRFVNNYVHDIKTHTNNDEGYGVITTSPGGANANASWVIAHNVFRNIERHAIYVSSGSSNGVVEGNVIRTCRSIGILLYATDAEPPIRNVTVSGNSISDIARVNNSVTPWGIGGTGNLTGLTIVGNSISNTECGIVFQGDPSYAPTENPTGLTIVGNTINDPNAGDGLGIAVYNAQDVLIGSNVVLRPSGTGILASVIGQDTGARLSRITIAGNEVSNAGNYGFNVSGGNRVSDVVLGHNTLRGFGLTAWNIPDDTAGPITYDLPMLTFHFAKAAVSKSVSKSASKDPDGDMMDGPLAGVRYYPAPSGKRCYVVGIAAMASGSISNGKCTVKLVKNGDRNGVFTVELSHDALTASRSIPLGGFAWLSDEHLGAALETSDDFAPSKVLAVTVVLTVIYAPG